MPVSYTESFRSDSIYFNNYLTRPIADHFPKHENGFINTSDQSGAGVKSKMIAILEDSDVDVGTLTTERPGMIVFEDDYQVVAQSKKH